jgi:hypothetical protein
LRIREQVPKAKPGNHGLDERRKEFLLFRRLRGQSKSIISALKFTKRVEGRDLDPLQNDFSSVCGFKYWLAGRAFHAGATDLSSALP